MASITVSHDITASSTPYTPEAAAGGGRQPEDESKPHSYRRSRSASALSSPSPAVAVASTLGTPAESAHFALGCFLLCALVFVSGAAPSLLPAIYIAFAAVALPWRIVVFIQRKWAPFLVDFCYVVNAVTLIFLLWAPDSARLEAVLYTLAEGPLACALLVWRCTWLLGSADHTISVLIHLLPGLALFAHRFLPLPTPAGGGGHIAGARALVAALLGGPVSIAAQQAQQQQQQVAPQHRQPQYVDPAVVWLFVAPLACYCAWQFVYWLLIQVIFLRVIRRHGWDTSYNALARRAAARNGPLHAWIRTGSTTRRIIAFGLLQLAFTLVTILLAIPTYFYYPLAAAWQVAKFAIPLWYGAQYQCRKLPETSFLAGVEKLAAQGLVSRDALLGPSARAPAVVLSE